MSIDERTSEKKLFEYRCYHLYLSLKDWKALNETETAVLISENLYDVFVASRYANLKNYIQN